MLNPHLDVFTSKTRQSAIQGVILLNMWSCHGLLGQLLPLLVLFIGAGQLAAAQVAEVTTTDQVPGSGMFHHLTIDKELEHIYAADTPRHTIHRKRVKTGTWEVFAGQVDKKGYQDGPSTEALLNAPNGLCINPLGSLIVADSGNSCIRQISSSGNVSTLAGTCGKSGARDGPGGEALFSSSMKSIVCLANCSLLVGDVSTGRLRVVVVHDAQCQAAAAAQRHSRRQWSTRQAGLLAAGCASLALLAAAAGTAAVQRLHTSAGARVLGYRQLREAADPAPPPEMRRRLYQLKGLTWNLRHQAAERAAAWGCQGWTKGSLGSMETETKVGAVDNAPAESGPAGTAHAGTAPATGDLLGLEDETASSLPIQESQEEGGGRGKLQLATEKVDQQQKQLGAIMSQLACLQGLAATPRCTTLLLDEGLGDSPLSNTVCDTFAEASCQSAQAPVYYSEGLDAGSSCSTGIAAACSQQGSGQLGRFSELDPLLSVAEKKLV